MKKLRVILAALALLLLNCRSEIPNPYAYQPPLYANDGLAVGLLQEVQTDTTLIAKLINGIRRGIFGEVHALLIYKDGKLVLEEYFPGHKYQWDAPDHYGALVNWDKSTPHCAHSVSKSITSACIGIALEKGFIKSADQAIFDYLPEFQHLKTDGMEKITIEHLLTMTSGLLWQEWNAPLSSVENDQVGIWFSDKTPLEFILERPLMHEPGTHFNYSGGNVEIMRAILENAAGMSLDTFSKKYLFEPLGIGDFDWWLKFRTGETMAAAGLSLTPRSMIKIGATFLNKGTWQGNRIVSAQWVNKCAANYAGNTGIKIPGEDFGRVGYGYTWWTKQFSKSGKIMTMFWANGWGGQKIIVIPELNTTIALTGGNYLSKVRGFKMLEKYIIPAIN